jgi:hypothetical protein
MKLFIFIAGLVAVALALSEKTVEPEDPPPTAAPALTPETVCPGLRSNINCKEQFFKEHFAIKLSLLHL